MVVEKVTSHNIDKLYNMVKEQYTKENWRVLEDDRNFIHFLNTISVSFTLRDITLIEYVFLYEMSSQVIPLLEPLINKTTLPFYSEINDSLKQILKWGNHRTIHGKESLEEKLFQVSLMFPIGVFKMDASITFSGYSLIDLMGYTKVLSINDPHDPLENSIVGNPEILEARQLPIVKFFLNTCHLKNEYIKTEELMEGLPYQPNRNTWLNFLEWDDTYLTQIESYFTENLLTKLYTMITNNTSNNTYYVNKLFDTVKKNQIYDIRTPIDTISIRSGSESVKESRSMIKSSIDAINTDYMGDILVCQRSNIQMAINMYFIDYVELLGHIPYNWISFATLPTSTDGKNQAILLTDIKNRDSMDISKCFSCKMPENWNNLESFSNTYKTFGFLVYKHEKTQGKSLGNILLSLVNPMSYVVKVLFNIPILEAAILLPELIERIEDRDGRDFKYHTDVFKMNTKIYLEALLNNVKSGYAIMLKS